MKNKAQHALDELKNNLYEAIEDYDWDENLEINYEPIEGEKLNSLIKPLQIMIDKYPEWILFTFDEEGVLNCPLPDLGEEVLISDGSGVIIDTFTSDDEGYYLDNSNWDLEGLAWMRLPKPHNNIYELAERIECFFENTDPFYSNEITDRKSEIDEIYENLKYGFGDYIVERLTDYISHGGPIEIIKEALELLEEAKKIV